MPIMSYHWAMVDEEVLNDFIRRMREIVEAIRATNPDRHHFMQHYWIWPHEYPGPAARIAEITEQVRQINPTMLDEMDIQSSVILTILKEVVADEVDEERFRTDAAASLRRLIEYKGYQELNIQLVNLIVRSPISFGGVDIHPIPNTGDTTEYELKYKGPLGHGGSPDFVYSYAAVPRAPGMGSKAWRNAIETADQVLTLFRGIGLPHLWGKTWLEAGIAGRGFASGWVVLRKKAGRPWDMALGSGGVKDLIHLERMLRNWSEDEITSLERIYTNERPSKVERKVLQALFWLGEATFPASNISRFVRLAVAFESAIGGESRRLSEIGVTEMLAERTAFVLGGRADARLAWHGQVKRLYGLRSRVMHGDMDSVPDDDLTRWAFLVWKTVRAMLNRTSQFSTVEEFADWIRTQRYTT